MEKRRFSRVPFRTLAQVTAPTGDVVAGDVVDLSMKGMFLSTDSPLPVGTAADVEIFLEGVTDGGIALTGTVVRVDSDGMGVEFSLERISLDALTHLRYIVSYNLGDGDTVMEEYLGHLHKTLPPDAAE